MPSSVDQGLPELLDAVVLQVQAGTFALAASEVRRFVLLNGVRALTTIPGAPPTIRGVVCVDEQPMLVLDLAELQATPPHRGNGTSEIVTAQLGTFPMMGIVCRGDDETVVFVGAQVRTVGRLRTARVPRPHEPRLVQKAVEWRGRAVPLLSVARLIAEGTLPSPGRRPRQKELS